MGELTDYGKSVHQVTDPADTTSRPDAPDTSSDVQAERETADDPSAVSRETRVAVTGDDNDQADDQVAEDVYVDTATGEDAGA